MKKIILLGVLIISCTSVFAQMQNYDNVRLMEFELGVGLNKAHTMGGGVAHVGIQFFFEPRINLPDTPFDISLQFSIGEFQRQRDILGNDDDVTNRGMVITGVDYNFRKWQRVSLFGGLGIGLGFMDGNGMYVDHANKDMVFYKYYPDRSFVLNPRIGAEFFNHLRVTLEYKWMRKPYSYFALNIGGVFGGGLKK